MVILSSQSARGGARAFHQMRRDELSGLLACQLWDGQHGLHQLADVGRRECRQHLDRQLPQQFGIAGMGLSPLQFDAGDEPQRRGGQGELVFPGAILAGLKIIPAEFRFGILKGAFGKIALTTGLNQHLAGE